VVGTLSLALIFCLLGPVSFGQVIPRNYAVEVSASVDLAGPAIVLRWSADSSVTNLTVSRRLNTQEAWKLLSTLPSSATEFRDSEVIPNRVHEYQILKRSSLGYTGAGYIAAGWEVAPISTRGRILVLVEHDLAGSISQSLDLLKQDLLGDGWTVTVRPINRNAAVTEVRSLVQVEHAAQKLRALLLLGHVPVAYSGNINPDGHANHRGAWPADVYYAELDGTWADSAVNATTAERDTNWNVPGDGK
jgi:hypothetical protein